MPALTVDVEGAVAFGQEHPDWYIFPGQLLPDGEGGFFKRPIGKWTKNATRGGDADAVRQMWTDLVGPSAKAIVCVACAPSEIWVLDDDRDLPPESGWPEMLDSLATLTLRSCTKGRPHYFFRADADGYVPKEGKWAGGDVKSSGIVFIGAGEPIQDLPAVPAPRALLEMLGSSMKKGGGAGREAVSSEEMWEWLMSFEDEELVLHGSGPEMFLETVLQRLRDDVDGGDHRRQACLRAVYAAAKEAAAGFYKPDEAYREIRAVYQELRDHDGSWSKERELDYDLMWSGVIAAVQAGDLDDEIESNREQVATETDDEMTELMESWTAVGPVKAMDPDEISGEALDTSSPSSSAISDSTDDLNTSSVATEPELGVDWGAISDSEPEPVPDGSGTSSESTEPSTSGGSGDDEPPRAWGEPEPEPEEPADPNTLWAAPSSVPPLASTDGERPRFDPKSPVWDTVHGRLARALADGAAEVSDVAILASSLVWAGTHLAGRGTHYIGADAHNPVVWGALVGRSAAARKSMSLSMMQGVYYGFPGEPGTAMDPRLWEPWLPRKVSGFNSGEVLIDSFIPPTPTGPASHVDDDDDEEDDEPYHNPRAVAVESELDRLWTAAGREGSVLSVVLCNAWDGSTMSIRSRGAGTVEIGGGNYVLGVLGAATESRAMGAVSRGDGQMAFSGLANRYLWWLLPDETPDLPMSDATLPWSEIYDYRDALELRVPRSAPVPIWGDDPGLTPDAEELWRSVYPWVKRGSKAAEGELARESLSRAEAQVRRLALNFALCRKSGTKAVDVDDMTCALAIWEYCRSSVRWMLAPERTMDAPGKFDNEVRRAMFSMLSDRSHAGWGPLTNLSEELRKDRGTISHHVKRMVEEGLLIEGSAVTGRRGKPPRVVALRKRWAEGTLSARSEGKGSKAGIELASVIWEK